MEFKNKYIIHLLCLICKSQSEILKTNNLNSHIDVVDYINEKRKIFKLEYVEYKTKISDVVAWFDQLITSFDNTKGV